MNVWKKDRFKIETAHRIVETCLHYMHMYFQVIQRVHKQDPTRCQTGTGSAVRSKNSLVQNNKEFKLYVYLPRGHRTPVSYTHLTLPTIYSV